MTFLAPLLVCLALAAPREQKAEPDAGKPPTPAHTGVRALLSGLKDDVTHVPSKPNAWLAAIGGGLALGARPFDATVNVRLRNHYDTVNAIFAPSKYYGDTPEQMAFSIGTWAIGRVLDKPKMSHLGMDLPSRAGGDGTAG